MAWVILQPLFASALYAAKPMPERPAYRFCFSLLFLGRASYYRFTSGIRRCLPEQLQIHLILPG